MEVAGARREGLVRGERARHDDAKGHLVRGRQAPRADARNDVERVRDTELPGQHRDHRLRGGDRGGGERPAGAVDGGPGGVECSRHRRRRAAHGVVDVLQGKAEW